MREESGQPGQTGKDGSDEDQVEGGVGESAKVRVVPESARIDKVVRGRLVVGRKISEAERRRRVSTSALSARMLGQLYSHHVKRLPAAAKLVVDTGARVAGASTTTVVCERRMYARG